MEQWGLILGDSVVLLVALAGGIVTLVRARRLRPAATVPAAIACVILVLGMILDLVWWTVIVDAAYDTDDLGQIEQYNNIGVLITMLLVAAAVGLLIIATHGGRQAPPPPGYQPVNGAAPANQNWAEAPAGPTAAPTGAAGWTPPHQAHPNDWNVMSGVWSIPPGTFDGPPPGQQQHR